MSIEDVTAVLVVVTMFLAITTLWMARATARLARIAEDEFRAGRLPLPGLSWADSPGGS